MDLFEKCRQFSRASTIQLAQAQQMYPYFIPLQSQAGPEVVINGRKMLMFGSNNYLGLTQHPEVVEAAIKAVEKYGTSCTGSRLLNGTLDLHEELEQELARWLGKEAALVFTTGFQTNLGAISALVGRRDVALIDRTDHASIVDATRLSFGQTARFKHNDMADLERLLEQYSPDHGVLIVVDGVFSMEGDLADLPRIVELKRRYGARLFLDDAHGLGVLGPTGRGTAEHFGLLDQVDVIMGTFSKSFASTGGFVAGPADVVWYIKHTARSFLFSASIPPASAAAALAALRIIQREPERLRRLWHNARVLKEGFERLGLSTGRSQSPIVPIILGDELKVGRFWKGLFDRGVYVNAAVAPAVTPGSELIRTSCIATHTDEHLERMLAAVAETAREVGLVQD
ncbi:MAG: 8-amino-7-oxononanoate synthase [Chloroflexota bacterium]